MQSFKEILNNAAKQGVGLRELSQEESAALKRCLLDIYQEVARICDSHHLVMMLGGGSCLGAVRHKGFIPWDDDLDLLMPRKDYEQLIKLCEEGELGNDYFICYPNKNIDSPTMFLKVFRKETLMKGLGGENSPYPQECFIDIFPIEGMSNNKLVRKAKGMVANLIRLIANTVAESGKMTDAEKSFYKADKKLERYMAFRRFLGRCFSLVNHGTWVRWYDSLVRNFNIEELAGIPTGRKLFDGETFESSVYFPPTKGIFENIEVYLPADTDSYLTNLYHNFMELPPKEKRERHFFIDFSVPDKFYK